MSREMDNLHLSLHANLQDGKIQRRSSRSIKFINYLSKKLYKNGEKSGKMCNKKVINDCFFGKSVTAESVLYFSASKNLDDFEEKHKAEKSGNELLLRNIENLKLDELKKPDGKIEKTNYFLVNNGSEKHVQIGTPFTLQQLKAVARVTFKSLVNVPDNEILIFKTVQLKDELQHIKEYSSIFFKRSLKAGTKEDVRNPTYNKSNLISNDSSNGEYSNLNLNQNHGAILTPVQSSSKTNNDKKSDFTVSDDYPEKQKLHPLINSFKSNNPLMPEKDDKKETKKCWKKDVSENSTSKSTLSDAILAYENSEQQLTLSADNNITPPLKKILNDLELQNLSLVQHSFETPRQEEGFQNVPEIAQFAANQGLLNPNELIDVPRQQIMDPIHAINEILTGLGLPEIFNAFNNGRNAALDALQQLENLVMHANTTLQFMYLFDEFMNCRAMKIYRPRREFYALQFYLAFGYTPTAAEHLLLRIGRHFQRDTRRNWALYTPEVLMISLRILRTGCDFWNAGFFIGPSRATAHRCFWQFIDAVRYELYDLISLRGTQAQWMHHATNIYNEFEISNVIGAIDGSYIPIRNIGDENIWICRKGYAAMNLTIFVDSSGLIRFASYRWSGRMHDVNVYRRTSLYQDLHTGRFQPFPGAVILGDSAYVGADRFILAHPRVADIQPHQELFYEHHREARSIVERVIGQLKGKFGILSVKNGFLNFRSRQSCSEVIHACCCLFNFSMIENGFNDDSEEHVYFRDLDPNLTPAEDLIQMFNEEHNQN